MSFIDLIVSSDANEHSQEEFSDNSISVWGAIPALVLLDFIAVFLVFLGMAYAMGNHLGAGGLALTTLTASVSISVLGIFSCYRIELIQNPRLALWQILAGWTLPFALASLIAISADGSRIWLELAGGLLCGWIVLLGGRTIASYAFKAAVQRGLLSYDIVIVGSRRLVDQLVKHCNKSLFGIRARGVFADDGVAQAAAAPLKLSDETLDRLVAFGATQKIDTIVVAVPAPNSLLLSEITDQLSTHFVNVQWLGGEDGLVSQSVAFETKAVVPGVRLVPLAEPPFRGWRAAFKRCFDFGIALAAIIFLAPVLAICAAAVKISDPGPALFRQSRIGYGNRPFQVYKFRSMWLDRCGHEKLTERDDPRVFAFGRIMRKLSLDELPQLFNVIRGDMSLVGPRPHMPEARAGGILYSQAVANYALRHRVKPGITGWAQVSGWRGPTDTVLQLQRRVDHDLDYIENWSLLLDLKIIVKTALMGFFGTNAF